MIFFFSGKETYRPQTWLLQKRMRLHLVTHLGFVRKNRRFFRDSVTGGLVGKAFVHGFFWGGGRKTEPTKISWKAPELDILVKFWSIFVGGVFFFDILAVTDVLANGDTRQNERWSSLTKFSDVSSEKKSIHGEIQDTIYITRSELVEWTEIAGFLNHPSNKS